MNLSKNINCMYYHIKLIFLKAKKSICFFNVYYNLKECKYFKIINTILM